MKNLTHSLCILTGALALAAGACSSSSPPASTGKGGSSGNGGSTGNPGEMLINIAPTGFAMDATTGIIGAFYAYGDSVGPGANLSGPDTANSDCVSKGKFDPTKCSQIDTPKPGQPFDADPTGAFCTSGTAAQVLNGSSGSPDYSDMWGAGVSLDLNNPGGDAGVKMDWNGSNYKGVAFDITPGPGATSIPAASMRVNFPFTGEHGTDSPYYNGALKSNSALPSKGGHVQIHWTDVGGPSYLMNQTPPVTPPAFDVTKIQSIQWQVFTNVNNSIPYSFCISNLAVLTE